MDHMRLECIEWEAAAVDGVRLQVREWLPAEGGHTRLVVCLVHGMGEHSGRYSHVADRLTEAGYPVLALDLRGHGKSQGKRGHAFSYELLMADLALLLNQAAERHPGRLLILYGHSMGGNLVLNYVIRHASSISVPGSVPAAGLAPHGVIATSPWLRLTSPPPVVKEVLGRWMSQVWPGFGQSTGLVPAHLSRDERVVQAYVDDSFVHDRITARMYVNMVRAGRWVLSNGHRMNLPLLLMHGSDDHITSASASRQFAESAGKWCRYREWPEAYHELHNEPERELFMDEVIAWLNERVNSKNRDQGGIIDE